MLLVTWNVNSLKARLPRVLELLGQHRPDVVCLQETKVEPAHFPHLDLAAAGYRAVDHSGGRWAGVAICARQELPLGAPALGLPGEPDVGEARWIEATVGGLRVVSTYVPNGRALGTPQFAAKLGFLDAAIARAGAIAEPLVIAGDINVAPADIDVYDPAAFVGGTHVTEEERSRVRVLEEGGLVDAFRHLHPDEVGHTWWDYRAGHYHKRLGLRIDLALVSVALADRLVRCEVDRSFRKGAKPSDHAPLLVELAP